MKSLFQHIEYLLITHDCVIIPGLGAFIASSKPACIDYVNQRMLPPSRFVMFNQAVTNDDGLLANSYARKYSFSFEEARQVILKEIDKLLFRINKGETVSVGRIGSLTLADESKLYFKPANFLSSDETLGLCDLNFQLDDSNKVDEKSVDNLPLQSIEQVLITDDLKKNKETTEIGHHLQEEMMNDSELPDNQYYYFRIRRSFVKYTAVFSFVISFILAVILFPVPRDSREQRASVVPVEAIINNKSINKVDSSTLFPPRKNIINNDVKDNIAEISKDSVEQQHCASYYLIVGTFHNKSEAENFASLNRSEHYPLFTVSSKKLTRVAVAASDNREELRSKLNKSSFLRQFPNAWIWSR